jgi:hypothetical protein
VHADTVQYRVDGEVGRFEFTTHWIEDEGRCVYNTAQQLFPPRIGKEWYATQGYKALAMMTGATAKSYRKTTTYLNRFRHQEEGGTPMRTLRDQTRREGERLHHAIEQQVESLFEAHHIPHSGLLTALPQGLAVPVETTQTSPHVVEALTVCQAAAPAGTCLQDNPVPYEVARTTVNVCLDDVGAKRQKAVRSAVTPAGAESPKTVQHTVAHVEQAGRGYVLTGSGLLATLRVLMALLVQNGCLGYRLQFFTDGYRPLQKTLLQVFAWHPAIILILDWYHLQKKCAHQLSLAMKGREVRNAALKQLLPLLWYGLVEQAMAVIKALDPAQIRNDHEVKRLIGYLERNRAHIPCYAVRKRLGLRNSSQLGEKMNDIVVADRQKRRGMSWSEAGSVALASLTALVKNGEVAHWLQEGCLEFKLAA